jgi:hypothetical protein
MDKKFDQMDKKFDQMEGKIDQMEEKFDKKFDYLEEKFDKKFDQMEEKFDQMEGKIDYIKKEISAIHEELFVNHEIGYYRAKYLESTVNFLQCSSVENKSVFATVHSAFYEGKVFMIGAKHINCIDKNIIACEGIDAMLIPACPIVNTAINISNYAQLRTGDQSSALGYIEAGVTRYWVGHISGLFQNDQNPFINSDEYVFESASQMAGMSGSGVINGCGYTGMAHANENISGVNMAIVLPAEKIIQCVRNHLAVLPSLRSCSNISVEDPPKQGFACMRSFK